MTRRQWIRSAAAGAAIPGLARPRPQASKEVKAIDTHAHIFSRGLALAPVHRYAPDYDATLDRYLALSNQHGITGSVLIQPSFLGIDNSYLLAALRAHRDRLRGIAVINPETDEGRLDEFDDAGCVGIRLNLFGFPDPDLHSTPMRRLLKRLAALEWQVEIHAEAHRLPTLVGPLLDAGVPIVIDHFGRPDPKAGVDDPGFQYLLSIASRRHVWIKISGAYRNGDHGVGERIALDAIPLLKRAFGLDRMLWGSDWPHTQFEQTVTYETSYRFLRKMLPDAREREIVLARTPAALFKFRHQAAPIVG